MYTRQCVAKRRSLGYRTCPRLAISSLAGIVQTIADCCV